MNKRFALVLVALLAIGVVLILTKSNNAGAAKPTTVAEAKAKAQNPLPACLEENKNVEPLQQDDQNNISLALTSQLIDVPAGTGADIVFSTYDEKTATGTEVYDGDYGSYNFAIKKDASATWNITSFEQCAN